MSYRAEHKFSFYGSELVLYYWIGKWSSDASEIHRVALQSVSEPILRLHLVSIPFIQLWMRKRKDIDLRGPWVGQVWAYCILRTWLENYQSANSKTDEKDLPFG